MKIIVTAEYRDYIIEHMRGVYPAKRNVIEVHIATRDEIEKDVIYFCGILCGPISTELFDIYHRPNVFFKDTIMVYACPSERYEPLFMMEG